jgi:hypothetical protein
MPTLFEGTVTITLTMLLHSTQPDVPTATADMQAQGNQIGTNVLAVMGDQIPAGGTSVAVVGAVTSSQYYPT